MREYVADVSELLLEERLRDSEEGSDVRERARQHTLYGLQGLAPSGKREVMRFLIKADLAQDPQELARNVALPGENQEPPSSNPPPAPT